jgi:hypothetical protein
MAKPKATKAPKPSASKPAGTTPLNINLPDELFDSLDAWVERLNNELAGPRWTRTDVVKATLARAIRERGSKGEAP